MEEPEEAVPVAAAEARARQHSELRARAAVEGQAAAWHRVDELKKRLRDARSNCLKMKVVFVLAMGSLRSARAREKMEREKREELLRYKIISLLYL